MVQIVPILNQISGTLSALSTQIISTVGDDRPFNEMWNWQQPGITRYDLTDRIAKTIENIQRVENEESEDSLIIDRLNKIPDTIQYFQSNSLLNLPGSNAYFVCSAFTSMLDAIDALVLEFCPAGPDWQEIQDKNLLPAQLKKRLDHTTRGIANVEKQFGSVEDKIQVISDAYQAASDLPASLAGLEDAKVEYEKSEKNIKRIAEKSEKSFQDIEIYKEKIQFHLASSHEVAGQIEEVYSAATRQGLGKAFQDRSNELKISTYVLMGLLFVTLAAASLISHSRISYIETLLSNPSLGMQVLWANIILTAISVAAPIWFAWLLTRQIGQRFRLAEDYGFKASVAKAYEGYRREAMESGDEALQNRLLQIALDRIEEAPLSHIEQDEAASPLHEFLKSRLTKPSKKPEQPNQ